MTCFWAKNSTKNTIKVLVFHIKYPTPLYKHKKLYSFYSSKSNKSKVDEKGQTNFFFVS